MRYAWIILLLTLGCQRPSQDAALRIAVAANMQPAMRVLADSFTAQTGTPIDLIVGASGQLTAQIRAGAPYHLFLSANTMYPDTLAAAGFAERPPLVYATGRLVLWVRDTTLSPVQATLRQAAIRRIAIAQPRVAPYGLAAKAALVQDRSWDVLQPKLVYGESISQVNAFIETQAVDAAFTALSVVRAGQITQGSWRTLPLERHPPIAQAMILLRDNPHSAKAAFWDYLQSAQAQRILRQFGYDAPKNPPAQ